MEEALRSLIVSDAGVGALVSTRVYWRQAPQSVDADFINLTRVSGQRDYHMASPSGLENSRVQADCWASSYSAAKAIARAVANAVSGYKGTVGGKRLQGVFIDSERDDDFETTGGRETRFRTSLDLILWHD